jgi:hypothetical protein
MLIVVLNALQITFLVILSVIFVFLSFFIELMITNLIVSQYLLFRFFLIFFCWILFLICHHILKLEGKFHHFSSVNVFVYSFP